MNPRTALLFALTALVAVPTLAHDLGNRAPVKASTAVPPNVPAAARQGGDTIFNAFVIPALPFEDAGTTFSYNNDYDEACPYDGSTSPDVVYRYTAVQSELMDVDLCGSAFDTKVYVWDEQLELLGCNDDYYFSDPCGVYVSKLVNLPLQAGGTYYIVIDGYGGDYGAYQLAVTAHEPCDVTCPEVGLPEFEPPLVPDYVDHFNGGCNTPPDHPFQSIWGDYYSQHTVCGESGWYTYQGSSYRDTDWFVAEAQYNAPSVDVIIDAEQEVNVFELWPHDCDAVAVRQSVTAGPCQVGEMSMTGYGYGDAVWIWVGPTVFSPPPGADSTFEYVLQVSGIWGSIPTESRSWGAVKSLFR